jgi:hypothetical protein
VEIDLGAVGVDVDFFTAELPARTVVDDFPTPTDVVVDVTPGGAVVTLPEVASAAAVDVVVVVVSSEFPVAEVAFFPPPHATPTRPQTTTDTATNRHRPLPVRTHLMPSPPFGMSWMQDTPLSALAASLWSSRIQDCEVHSEPTR